MQRLQTQSCVFFTLPAYPSMCSFAVMQFTMSYLITVRADKLTCTHHASPWEQDLWKCYGFLSAWVNHKPARKSVRQVPRGISYKREEGGCGMAKDTVRVTSRVCTSLYICEPMCMRSAAWARCLPACMQMPDNPVSMRMDFHVSADWVFTRPICHYFLTAHVCTSPLSFKLGLTLSVQRPSRLHAWVCVSAKGSMWVNVYGDQMKKTTK